MLDARGRFVMRRLRQRRSGWGASAFHNPPAYAAKLRRRLEVVRDWRQFMYSVGLAAKKLNIAIAMMMPSTANAKPT